MRFQKIGLTTVVLCTVGIQQSFSIDIVTKEKPNIVFILADDLRNMLYQVYDLEAIEYDRRVF